MQKILRSPASMRRKVNNKTFGVPLKELCRYGAGGEVRVPEVLQKVTDFIQMHGIGHEGIFRINGSSKVVDKLKFQYERHSNSNLEEAGDVMAVASLLKLFFRELPDPLICSHLHAQFLTVQEEFQRNREESLKQLKNLLQQLPEENFVVLVYLCRFLRKVTHYEDTNKMNSMALAIVFGPNLFRCAEGIQGLREQGQTNHLVRLFIDQFEFLFGRGRCSPPPSSSSSPSSPIGEVNGSGNQVWGSKRIEVRAVARGEKKSPPVTPMSYEQYARLKRAKQAQEEVDLNSNYSVPPREDLSTASPHHHGYLSTREADLDDRALSPFSLDSDQGTSCAPSPIASSVTSEVVERTIQESISQHLFGAHNSPRRDQSPRQQEVPVAMPRKKHQKKMQDGSTSFNRRSNSESALEHLVHSFEEKEGISVKARVQQFSDDTAVSTRSQDHVRRKGRPTSKAFDLFESQGIIIGQRSIDSLSSDGRSRDETLTDVTLDGTELDSVKRNSDTLQSLTAGRAAPPKRRSPSKKNLRDRNADDSPDSPRSGREKAAKRSNNSDAKPHSQEVWLRKNGEAAQQRSPTNGSPGGRNVREGGLWGVQMDHSSPVEGEGDPPVPQPRHRHRKAKEHSEAKEEEPGKRRKAPPPPTNGARKGAESGGSRVDGDARSLDGHEQGTKGHSHGRKKDNSKSRTLGEKSPGGGEAWGANQPARGLNGEEGSRNFSDMLRGQVVPPLDLTSLHINTEGNEAIQAWQGQTSNPTEKTGGGGGEKRKGKEKGRGGGACGNGDGTEEGGQNMSRLEKLQKITSRLHDPYDAPLSPRAKDAPPSFGSVSQEPEGPPSPVSQHDVFPRPSKHSESSMDPEEQAKTIKQLTRQVRSLKQKIKQYEAEFERQYQAKPSHEEKIAQPEIRKMIGELKRANKQLKALKSEARETNSPMHSTLPARLTVATETKKEEAGMPLGYLAGLKESLNLAQKRLQEKRVDGNRAFDILEMNQDEVRDEKVAIQKALLQLESKYGRPTSRSSKEVMKPLYDRYRTLKKILKNKEKRRSITEELNQSDLNTIEEHEETREFIPKQMGFVHSKYDQDQEEEAEDDVFGTADFRVTQMVSPPTGGQSQVQGSLGRSASGEDDICLSPNDSGRVDSPFSPGSASFHEASPEELVMRQEQAQSEKRRLRRVLKDFEENFVQQMGYRVQKEDRAPMEHEYNQYKHIKKQLKLLDALVAKHQSQTSAAVT